MGTSSSKVPRYDVVDPGQASSSGSPRPQTGSFSPPTQGLVQPQNSQWAPVQQAPAPPLPAGWDFAIDPATGYPYFFHNQTHISQWDDPRGPGYALPERNAGTEPGPSQRVIPPWEGGPANGVDPLTWPLPPGWQEQLDLATNQRYFVNYDARIMSYNDPRHEIAKAYGQGPTVQGVPAFYPAPAYGRLVETSYHEFRPPPAFGTAGAQSPGHQTIQQTYLPPPPPRKRKKQSVWSTLGYRHGSGRVKSSRPLHLGLLAATDLLFNSGGSGSSSSSSSDDDDESDGGGDGGDDGAAGAAAGGFLLRQRFGGGDGDDKSSVDLVGTGLGNGDGESSGVGGDMGAVEEYGILGGGEGPQGDPSGIAAGGGGGGGEGVSAGEDYFPAESFQTWHSQPKQTFLKAWSTAPKSRANKSWILDGYFRLLIVLTVLVGLYFGAFEGFVSLLFASAGRLILALLNSYPIIRARRKAVRSIRNISRLAFKKGSTLIRLTSPASATLVQMQAWFYEHMYEHPVVELRVLTAKDEAGPLHSRLPLRPREITIVTQASADRLPAVEAMATSWGGTICVAFHAGSKAELKQLYPKLCDLHKKVEAQRHCRLHFCVAMEESLLTNTRAKDGLYPINAMRNLALSMAVTELVLILDADFVPSQRMHDILTGDEKLYFGLLRKAVEERHMLVIPAFEATGVIFEDLETSAARYPTTYYELREKWVEGTATAFHCSHFARGHKPTNYERFFNQSTSRPYKVQYREYYEPYAICARNLIPPFDARFRGYGMNKISHAYHCAAKGMGFTVLPRVFVWSLPHRKSQAWTYTFGANKDPLQKLRILGLYRRFKREVLMQRRSSRSEDDGVKSELLEIRVEPPLQDCRLATKRHQEVQIVM